MNETEYNKFGTFDIIDIVKLIIDKSELDELKQLVVVSKYFNLLVHEQFSKLQEMFLILDEYFIVTNMIAKNDANSYMNIKFKQINRKLINFAFGLLRKNRHILVDKMINHINKYNHTGFLMDRNFYYRLFFEIITKNYTNEQTLLKNLIKISPSKVNWSIIINYLDDYFDNLRIENIILIILDLLKAAIILNNEDLIVTLIKGYYKYDLYNYEETPKDLHLELINLVESLEKSSNTYTDIVNYV